MKRNGSWIKQAIVLLLCIVFVGSVTPSAFGKERKNALPQPELSLYSSSAIVYDASNGRILYEKNKDEKRYPASLTKMMTVYAALQLEEDDNREIVLDEVMFRGLYEENASMAGFAVGETVRFKDLIYGAMLPSGAEACQALAIATKGSVEEFVAEMNRQAEQLGMTHTHFVNTSGLHDDDHYTSAGDMLLLLEAALQDELFLEAYGTDVFVTAGNEVHPYGVELSSTRLSELEALGIPEDFFEGSKTGFTTEAGKCLATSTWDDDVHLLYVSMLAEGDYYTHDHFADAYTALTYFKEHYENKVLYQKGDLIADLSIKDSLHRSAGTFYASEKIALYVPQSITAKQIKKSVEPLASLQAPYQKGDTLAKVAFTYEDLYLGEMALNAHQDIDAHPFLYILFSIWWWMSDSLVRLLVIAMIVYMLIWCLHRYRRKKRRRKNYRSALLYQRQKR